jgi:hypothetical protein
VHLPISSLFLIVQGGQRPRAHKAAVSRIYSLDSSTFASDKIQQTLLQTPTQNKSTIFQLSVLSFNTPYFLTNKNVSLPGIHDSGSSLPPSRTRRSSVLLTLSRKAPRCQSCRHPPSLRHRTLRILLLKSADRLSFVTARRADAALLSILPSQPHRRKPKSNPSTSQIRGQRLPLSSAKPKMATRARMAAS